ncbi:MAG: hypothetical protein ACM3VT_11445 [Solirubrobacterales bacterium]
MRGIATIDRQPGCQQIAVWITSRTGNYASHGNAVVIDSLSDSDAVQTVRSLTRHAIVHATDGSVIDGLPLEGVPLRKADFADLVTETEEVQAAILAAIAAYKTRTRAGAVVSPTFPTSPIPDDFQPEVDEASRRAFAAANYACSAWRVWLATDDERRKRTVQPRTGSSPWMMPIEMNSQTAPDFPPKFSDRLRVQALV